MILIIGGRSQGKTTFAHEKYGPDAVFIDNLHDIIKGWLVCLPEDYTDKHVANKPINDGTANIDMSEADILSSAFIQNVMNDIPPDAIVICDEVGCGIVPLDRSERLYRDIVGHVCCAIAARAENVIRVHCGIGMKIK